MAEMHRTQTRFEDAFTLKVFIFQFANFYSSPIYIAFFKGRWVHGCRPAWPWASPILPLTSPSLARASRTLCGLQAHFEVLQAWCGCSSRRETPPYL